MVSNIKTFGTRLKTLRRRKGISQRELSANVGIDFTYISKIENDQAPPPSEEAIIKIAHILDEDPDILLIAANKIPERFKHLICTNKYIFELLKNADHLTPKQWKSIHQLIAETKT